MKKIIILLATALLILGSSINAQPMGKPNGRRVQKAGFQSNKMMMGGGPMQMNRMERMATILKLSDDQKTKVSDIKFKHDNIVLDAKNGIAKNRLVIRKMMTDNKIDESKLLSLTSANTKMRSKISESKIQMWLSVYKILDDTQKTEWTKIFGEMGHHNNHGKHGGMKGMRGMAPRNRMR